MKITISDKIYIYNPPKTFVKAFSKALTLPNPAYETLVRRAKRTGDHRLLYAVNKDFKYYTYKDEIFTCGRGNEKRIINYCNNNTLDNEIEYDLTDIGLTKELKFNGKLRDYQIGIADQIIEAGNNGVIKLGTGFGKTLIACEIIRKLNKTALIIVPRVSLLTQFKQEFKKFYDYKVGVIQGKTWDIKDITVASMATLGKRDTAGISKNFSIIIVDEGHTAITKISQRVIQSFNPKHLFTATATPRRSDEQGEAIFYTFGPILIDKALPQKKPKVQVIKSNVKIAVNINYGEMIDDMVESEERNKLIADIARREFNNKRKILILTKRVRHYKEINKWLHSVMKVCCISSEDKQSDRDELLTKLRNNEEDFDVIMGTYSMLSTGVDIPLLDTIIFAGDVKSSVLTEQSVGRILRILHGKNDPRVLDINDNLNGILYNQYLARRRFYLENNWEIL